MFQDLYREEGKAELIGGRIVRFIASGVAPSKVAFRIAMSLEAFAQQTGRGEAFPDGIGYAIKPPLASGRQSFSPDASYYLGPLPANQMKFVDGPPTFAVEVRSADDYGDAADEELAAKRVDYFEAGTLAVWDVDPRRRTIALYLAESSEPTVFSLGDIAHAEPAVAGWRLEVGPLFAGIPG
jgi:Uma2 family endonuclease